MAMETGSVEDVFPYISMGIFHGHVSLLEGKEWKEMNWNDITLDIQLPPENAFGP